MLFIRIRHLLKPVSSSDSYSFKYYDEREEIVGKLSICQHICQQSHQHVHKMTDKIL